MKFSQWLESQMESGTHVVWQIKNGVELRKHPTHWSIVEPQKNGPHKVLAVGQEKYVKKIWDKRK
jgi:hypothetical protein